MSLFILNSKSTKSQKSFPCTLLLNCASSNRGLGEKNAGSAYCDLIAVLLYSKIWDHESVIKPPAIPLGSSVGLTTTPSHPAYTVVLAVATSLRQHPASVLSLAFCLGASLTPQRGTLKKLGTHTCVRWSCRGLIPWGSP